MRPEPAPRFRPAAAAPPRGASGRDHERGILFEELEKAHPLVLNLFLQILWHGRVTVATGQVLRFGDYFIGFTSNIGAADAMRMERSRLPSIEQAVLRRVEQELRPELVGRTGEKLVFARLRTADLLLYRTY